jgi:hypothetical protein
MYAETPLLVSLLWLVCIAHLFLMPGVSNRSLVVPSSLVRDPVKLARMITNGVKMIRMTANCVKMKGMTTTGDAQETLELGRHGRRWKSRKANCVKMKGMTTTGDAQGTLELGRHGRRWKSRKARMKFCRLPWHATAVC